jgi:hypothetical protein
MSKFLLWLQERIKRRTKTATPALISGLLADLTPSQTDLVVENIFLCQQLIVFFSRYEVLETSPKHRSASLLCWLLTPSAQNYEVKLN